MGPVEAIATTTLWNTSLARPERKVGLVPTLKYLVEHWPPYCARVADQPKEGPHADDHKQRTDSTDQSCPTFTSTTGVSATKNS